MNKVQREVADLFCGLGGTSTGVVKAANRKNVKLALTAINHWPTAVASHEANYPWAKHMCEDINFLDPRKAIPSGHLDLLVASPECIYHSRARGGMPVNDQSRVTANRVFDWLDRLHVDNVFIENVPEFREWGPLDANNKPIKSMKGQIFLSFIDGFRNRGYNVDYKTVVCANFGDATTRERLFIIARKDGQPIVWPDPTHSKDGGSDLFNQTEKWHTAREIIDWDVKGKSIFNRERPLSPNTMKRIMKGLKKFSKLPIAGEPFIVKLYGTNTVAPIDEPLPTVTAGGQHLGVAEPYLVEYHSASYDGGDRVRDINDPLPTVDTRNRHGLVEPYILTLEHSSKNDEPFITAVNHGDDWRRNYSVDGPMPTITSVDAWGLAEPFLIGAGGPAGQNRTPHSIDEPLSTVLTDDHHAVAESYIIGQMSGSAPRSVDDPLMTITGTSRGIGLAEPFLVKYYGTAGANSVDEPLDAVTTKDRFALCVPLTDGYAIVDILYRMLMPGELAASHGFNPDYIIKGTREQQVKQIGNSVPTNTACAHIMPLL